MNVSEFLSGNFLTHLDLPAPTQIWTVRDVQQQLVGTDQKICVHFNEHQKPLGLNKTNLRTIADAHGLQSEAWIGKQSEVFKDRTTYQGRPTDCVRLRVPADTQPAANSAPAAATQQPPVAAPQPAESPAAGQQPAPWQ